MLSIQKCKEALTQDGERFTDEEIKQIREKLYQLAHIELENYKNKSKENSDYSRKSVN